MRALAGPIFQGPFDAITNASAALTKIQPYLDIVNKVLEDPALPEVAKRVRLLIEMHKAEDAKASGQLKGVFGATAGIGLYKAIKPLDAYIYYKRNWWIMPLTITAGIGVPLAIGLLIGRATAPSSKSRTRH